MSITFKTAMAIRSANPLSNWPERGPENRLEPVARPSFATGVVLSPGAVVMTMGSCFARNIEEYLGAEGHVVPVLAYSAPAEEFQGGGRIAGILNKYTPASIVQELEWVAKVADDGGVVTFDHIADFSFENGEDMFLDMQLSSSRPVSRARLVERRQAIFDIHKRFFDCDIAILTPGLTEGWVDTSTGLFIQQPPNRKMLASAPDRFQFDNIDMFRCHDMLMRTVTLLKARGARKIAFSVSPVPLASTFTERDVLIANTYSKSVLRAVVGTICDSDDSIAYIPSFERVMLTKQADVWQDDLRHVADSFVGGIVKAFVSGTDDAAEAPEDETVTFNTLCEKEKWGQALALYEASLATRTDIRLPSFHRNAARLMMKKGHTDLAIKHARVIQDLQSTRPTGYMIEMRALAKKKQKAEIAAVAERGARAVSAKMATRITELRDKLV